MSEVINAKLDFARKLVVHLGAQNLPKALIDDRRLRIDSEARSEDETLLAHFDEDSLHSIKTVRFIKDFYNYKAGVDRKTSNLSFIRTAELFRQQGIRNYYFILQLNNRMLQGVNPHADDLTNEQRLMVAEECRSNFWYFLREVCMLKPDQSFMANRGNISFIWNYLNHITTYMIMPRQQGKMQPNHAMVRVQAEKVGGNQFFKDRWKRMGDVRTGDVLVTPNGKTTNVIGVHPQGKLRTYAVTFSDGRVTEAGAEHLWTLKDFSRGTTSRRGIWDDYTTSDLILAMGRGHAFEVPLVKAEKGCEQRFTLDPYLMGWMVNASLDNGALCARSLNKEQDAYLDAVIPQTLHATLDKKMRVVKRRDGNPFVFDLKVGLPQHYLEGSVEDRLKLLQAFLDHGLKVGKVLTLKTPNALIATQLTYLIRGLGGTARPSQDTLTLTLPKEMDYFRFRKDKNPEVENRLWVEKITYSGDYESTCLEVDAQDHLYITDNFVVTHNTVSVQVINFWLTYINGRGYKSHLITLKSDNRAQFIDAIKKIRTCMPAYLINPTWRDKDSGNYLNYKAFGEEYVNTLNINVPQMGRDAAGDLGRGLTVETTTYDEPAYISFIEEIINGCAPSALTAMANARVQGKPYGISFITTPNTTLHPSGEFMFEKLMNSTEWREKFFDSFSESHLKERLLRASPKKTTSPSVAMVYNYLQLGKDKDWVKETIDSLNLSLSKAKIDLLLMWVEDGENRLFDDVTREAINNCKREKVWSKEYVTSGLFMDFFVSQQELIEMGRKEHNDFFLIGVDTSSAINKDACTIIVRSMKTGQVKGVGRYPLAFLDDVTAIIVDLLDVLKNSLLVIERNYAHHMIDNLLIMLPAKGMDPFTRIYNQVYQDTISHEKEFKETQNTKFAYRTKDFYLRYKQYFGFNTTATSRQVLYGLIQEAVGITGYGINYDKLADELINLRTKGGRIDHDSKRHDDLVISWLLTYWFIKLGLNKSLYGIMSGIALTDTKNILNQANGRQEAELEPHVAQFLDKVRQRAAALTEELFKTNDNLLAIRLEAEIRKMSRMLPPAAAKFMTVDTLIAQAQQERSKRMLETRKVA